VNILIVDDHPANLVALEAVLEPLGERLVKATSGEQALKALLQQEFACIILDVRMPGLDGLQTAKLIKQREHTRQVPVLFLTAFDKEDEEILRGYEQGAVDYLVKPFNPDLLRAKVSAFVDLSRREAQLRAKERRAFDQTLQASEAQFRHL
jgi:CheY-like chemotaxis protein